MYNGLLEFMCDKYAEVHEKLGLKIVSERRPKNFFKLYGCFQEFLDRVFSRGISFSKSAVREVRDRFRSY